MRFPLNSNAQSRQGAAVVEFAIVAPLLILLILGMIEFGRMIMVKQAITNATREGAREACLDGATKEKVQETVKKYLDTCGISGASIEIKPDLGQVQFREPITVTVNIPFSKVSWLPNLFAGKNLQLAGSSVMRAEHLE